MSRQNSRVTRTHEPAPRSGAPVPRVLPSTPPPLPAAADRAALRQEARRVLLRNWTGTSTVPSHGLYPHQWSWDSAFIAIGLRHLSVRRARLELETLTAAQWGDGRIPHIVFNPAVPQGSYFPGPEFWQSSTAGAGSGAPRTVETSGIVQPPVHALAAWLVHRADPESSRRSGFLQRLHPRLEAWHRYLAEHRDLGGGGLVAAVHPWEPGMDNSPAWDGPLHRVEPVDLRSFRRADLDHGEVSDRPTDLDYGRYVRLAADYRDRGYRDTRPDGARPGHAFAVEDPGTNALLAASEDALAHIAREVRDTGRGNLGADPARHQRRARELTAAMVDRLWDPATELFHCRDLRADTLLPERGAAGLLPLAAPTLPDDLARALVHTLTGPHFGLGGGVRMVPSHDLRGDAFDPDRYWRGPAWFNVNWLLERGLRQHGRTALADRLRHAVLETAGASGFAEYVDPFTGDARGTRDFGWTAALTLDLLAGAPAGPGNAKENP
ncbi:amylo-alpha-1,6-glucosidase [Streptomyces sp. TR06-5]|uniref:amylo-alpha-1,6-glucosidase n=1 Tax=unclassified Streptomyces TaxID=2593676 RepID=UPI0039A0D2E7